jgi:hypothetical protein
MPIFLKTIQRSLESQLSKTGVNAAGDYKFTPPNLVARKLSSYPNLPVSKATGVPNLKKGTIIYKGLVQSESSSDKYEVYVQFFNMEFVDEQDADHKNKITLAVNKKKRLLYHGAANVYYNPIACRCPCKDFQHRFAWPLADEDALVGKPIPYTRVTPAWPKGRPYANSTEKIGICKHLWSFVNELRKMKLLVEQK